MLQEEVENSSLLRLIEKKYQIRPSGSFTKIDRYKEIRGSFFITSVILFWNAQFLSQKREYFLLYYINFTGLATENSTTQLPNL